MADKTLEMALLFDFFGDLLTEKQREYFDLYYNNDLSLSEIAEISGISRQGVRDMLIRAENALREYESKTGVVKRFEEMQRRINELQNIASRLGELTDSSEGKELAASLFSGLQELKG